MIEEVDRSGLRGRGGAGFPAALKLAAVAGQRGRPIVIGNGTEGEPASAKDKVLLAKAPHLVLDGAALAAEMIGAAEAIVVCHRAVRDLVEAAVGERRRASIDSVRLWVVEAAPGFVAGEASAVVRWVASQDPRPTRTPPRLADRGYHGRPTLVQNVETFAHLALIGRYGASWFRSVGAADEGGSMLVTLQGAASRPGVYEVEIGMRIGDLIDRFGKPLAAPQAVLVGGYFGTWLLYEEAAPARLSRAGLGPLRASPGAGLLAVLPQGACGLRETAALARYLASQSAGQCGPCIFGLDAIAGELEHLAKSGTYDAELLSRWLSQVDGRGACSHPDGVVRLVKSALVAFEAELGRHAEGRCSGSPATEPILLLPGSH
jgi:NADH:ubiquinone oxidoreductase subunit F (NADH-binding)